MPSSIIARIKGNSNFLHIIKGSSVNSIAKIIATALGFIGSILISRHFGADMLGRIATISSMFSLLAVIALLGNQTYVLKLIPQQIEMNGYQSARASYHKVFKLLIVCTALVLLIYLAATQFLPALQLESLINYQTLLCIMVVLTVIKRMNLKALRALGDFRVFSLMEVLPAFFMMVTVILAIVFSIGEKQFIYLYYAPHLLVAVATLWALHSLFASRMDERPIQGLPTTKAMLVVSVPMFGISISNELISTVDILMIGHYMDESLVGVYSIYVKVVALPSIIISAVNSMFAPKISALNAAEKFDELRKLTKLTTLLAFGSTTCVCIVLLIGHPWFFSIYGEQFNQHLPAFYLLLGGILVNSFFGSVGFSLSMTGLHNQFFLIMVCAALVNITANTIMIPLYGLVGAAIATLITVFTWNFLSILVMKKRTGYTTLFFDLLLELRWRPRKTP